MLDKKIFKSLCVFLMIINIINDCDSSDYQHSFQANFHEFSNFLVYCVLAMISCAIFYIINKKSSDIKEYSHLIHLLKNQSLFYLIVGQNGEIINYDERHKNINDVIQKYESLKIDFLLQKLEISAEHIFIIKSMLNQDFELDCHYELKNISKYKLKLPGFKIINITSKDNDKNAINMLFIVNNSEDDLLSICNSNQLSYCKLSNDLKPILENQRINDFNDFSIENIRNLIEKNFLQTDAVANHHENNYQTNFIYTTNTNTYRIEIYIDFIWNNVKQIIEPIFRCITEQDNQLLSNANNSGWKTYCQDSLVSTAELDGTYKIININNSMFNFIQYNPEKSINFCDYIELDIVDSNLLNQLNNENPIIAQVKLRFNQKYSAFAYFHRIINKNIIIVYLIDNTRQKDLEISVGHSQKMQAIGQLAGGIAHDFNNLLTAMLGFCDLLLIKNPAGSASFPELMQIKQNTVRAINLVKQLLAFSRKQILQMKIVNLNDIILGLSDLLRRLIGENINLKTVYNEQINYTRADQGQLEQVLINLIVNARDSMPNGGEINIRTSQVSIHSQQVAIKGKWRTYNADNDLIIPGDYVVIEVEDNGCGIHDESTSKIFEPFYSTKEIGYGTGLGLSTVYGIVKQSGGYIYFSSKMGEGTIFYIYLKQYNNETKSAINSNIEFEEEIGQPIFTDFVENNLILLVEDESSVRLFAIQALLNKGYQVLSAKSGEEALQVVKNYDGKIDLIISDIIMPGISGYQLIEELKKTKKQNNNFNVLFISGYTEDSTLNKLIKNNKNYSFLNKPFTLKQLIIRVKEILQK